MGAEGIKSAIARLRRTKESRGQSGVHLLPESTFDAVLEMRLKELQRQMGEVKNRINGLFFFVMAAAIVQVAIRLL